MRSTSAFRALFLAAGLTVAAPGLSMAADLYNSVNNTPATGSPFAYPMATTQAAAQGLPENVGQSASANGNPLATSVSTTERHNASSGVPGLVGNSASARGGFGTGPRRG
ncbi:glycosyl transferase family 39 [Pseudoroseomonas rhizosphaerae]|uniref:Glycosyl transferase family 39 n=1 Tax=Teichococcus rhizosphaerae TaxID=1335062 RepID=A0A2C7A322_9PROT|nr:glycosyl transferase family 39 [Pseudoroseomonas rhizosphaerae]PHK94468.1 glycosyl transferase family 39 [Pseudoroseomonas rhizosphaerae]